MEGSKCRELVASTGRILLEKGLVARTWGNISARIDETRYAVSPSGLGYENMTAEDVPVYDLENDTWEGSRKPSSENRVHAAAYRNYPEVNFVIHTHQDYATAVGLVGTDVLDMTDEEKKVLGKVIVAKYGLPGSDELGNNVDEALKQSSKVILMKHHGVLILGEDRDDTMNKAEVLERVCKRAVEEKLGAGSETSGGTGDWQGLLIFSNRDVLMVADEGGFNAQIDDMAQMLGSRLDCVPDDDKAIMRALEKADAVLVKDRGCVIKTGDPDDDEALKLLIKKAALAKHYTRACGVSADLSEEDCEYMR
ncbi:MAG: class II aldolase/adducin family protein, partial [Lachnospiraceae bacterium]|nr:class II aldolase/adducin family protein [Lachnospiraceae bacterium]